MLLQSNYSSIKWLNKTRTLVPLGTYQYLLTGIKTSTLCVLTLVIHMWMKKCKFNHVSVTVGPYVSWRHFLWWIHMACDGNSWQLMADDQLQIFVIPMVRCFWIWMACKSHDLLLRACGLLVMALVGCRGLLTDLVGLWWLCLAAGSLLWH